jgi:hypothetical protein
MFSASVAPPPALSESRPLALRAALQWLTSDTLSATTPSTTQQEFHSAAYSDTTHTNTNLTLINNKLYTIPTYRDIIDISSKGQTGTERNRLPTHRHIVRDNRK